MADTPVSSQPKEQISVVQIGADRQRRHDYIGAGIVLLIFLGLAFCIWLDATIVRTVAFSLLHILAAAVGFFLGGHATRLRLNGN